MLVFFRESTESQWCNRQIKTTSKPVTRPKLLNHSTWNIDNKPLARCHIVGSSCLIRLPTSPHSTITLSPIKKNDGGNDISSHRNLLEGVNGRFPIRIPP
mmetsp:Transcript_52403/g.52786  ORF Transcript_52403/g.52786 Transcript_52403/m.52786 type:complete len:100 (-) Transcript_52403:653-952(-)